MSLLLDPLNTAGAPVATSTVFTPIHNGFSWTPSTTGADGSPLPSGETLLSVTLGIRPDGNASFGLGNYQYQVIVLAPATAESLAQLNAAINATLPPGDYWANVMQTDVYNGANEPGPWGTTEVPFAVLAPAVAPAAPTLLVS